MFPCLAAQETNVAGANFASWEQENVSESSQNIFASRTQILLPKRTFTSLATQGNVSENNVLATMLPSLDRSIKKNIGTSEKKMNHVLPFRTSFTLSSIRCCDGTRIRQRKKDQFALSLLWLYSLLHSLVKIDWHSLKSFLSIK